MDSNTNTKCMICGRDASPLYRIKKKNDILILCYKCGKSSFGDLWDFDATVIDINE